MPGTEVWPLVLFGLRLGAVALLYLFLFAALRALGAGVWAVGSAEPSQAVEAARPASPAPPAREAPVARRPARGGRQTAAAAAMVTVLAVVALGVLGGAALLDREAPAEVPAAAAAPAASPTVEPFGPPAVAPRPGRVTVGLAAVEPSHVRVTVDGTVQFDGILGAGQRQSWEGGQRIQVWTDKGKTLLLAVNGEPLGPYSPAMGHPDWNRIDFGFWPGWAR